MPIIVADIQRRLSGGAANSNPAASLGGAKSSVASPLNLFDTVAGDESAAGDVEYRVEYVHNNHPTLTLQGARLWITANTPGNRIAVGLGTSAINGTEQTLANESTAPAGVTFSQPTTKAGGLLLGDIPPGGHRAVHYRRTVAAGAAASNDTYSTRAEGDTAA
jgi:hypothetical protein